MIYLVLSEGGHGLETPGKETPVVPELKRRIKENEFNDAVVALLGAEFKRHDVHFYDVAPGSKDIPLKTRVDKANAIYADYVKKYGKANVKAVYISIHFNAFDGTFEGKNPEGFSVHIQPSDVRNSSSRLADLVLQELALGTKQISRGKVLQDLYVTRETNMPAILIEAGFMDNPNEARLMLNKAFQAEVAKEVATGVLRYFGKRYTHEKVAKVVTKVPVKEVAKAVAKGTVYRVQLGAFTDEKNAVALVAKAKKLGLDAIVVKG